MLQRTRSRTGFSKLIWRLADLLLLGLSLFELYSAASGLLSGEVAIFSKRSEGVIQFADSPLLFCFMILAWTGGGIFLLRTSVSDWRGR